MKLYISLKQMSRNKEQEIKTAELEDVSGLWYLNLTQAQFKD
jgi:hypothetical protein